MWTSLSFRIIQRLRQVPLGFWVAAASFSALVASVAKVGNVLIFVHHPVHHSILESIEVLDAAATIPVALSLVLLARPSRLIRLLTIAAIAGMVVISAISITWAVGWFAFGKELVPMILFGLAWIAILGWLVAASLLAWLAGSSRALYLGWQSGPP